MSEPLRSLSRPQARRLSLGAQGFLDAPDARGVNRRDLRRVMSRLKLLQLDSIPVVIRTQYMPAFSRLGPYRTGIHDELAYRDDEWFEAWAHEASLLPVALEPKLRWMKARSEAGHSWKSIVEFAERERHYVQSVHDELTSRGPLFASELSDDRPRLETGWGSSSTAALALDWLFRIGRVGIRRRGNFEKQFDLLENIVPPEVLAEPTPSPESSIGDLLVLGAEALGVGTANDLVDYFRLPPRLAKPLLGDLVEEGRLLPCTVKDWRQPAFMAPKAKIPRRVGARALVSPFDPVVWHRDRCERLFNFHYRIEIYVPAKKRKWGYYVLPFLLDDDVVARVDVKTDRKDQVLRVPSAYLETGQDEARVAAELAHALRDLAIFVGVERIDVGRRGNLSGSLRREVSALGS